MLMVKAVCRDMPAMQSRAFTPTQIFWCRLLLSICSLLCYLQWL